MSLYRISGLIVACDLDLSGVAAGAAGAADIVIEEAGEIADIEAPERIGPTWTMRGRELAIWIPGIARFRLSEGRRIFYRPDPGGDPRDVVAFLLGSMLGILLHQREMLVLHASAVEANGRAMLFCGRSGAGKSTLAAALGRRGLRLITEDVCAVDLGGAAPCAAPDARRLRLWAEAGAELGMTALPCDAVRPSIAKFHFDPQSGVVDAPVPIAAIYVLREQAGAPGIMPLSAADAVRAVRRQAYRPPLVALMGQEQLYFRHAARLIAQVGMFELHRPFDFGAMEAVLDRLEAHWTELAGVAA